MIKESRFNKIYERIITECNVWNITMEYVNEPSITPVNKNLFNYICSQIRKPTSYIKISFNKILSYVQRDNYEHINRLIEVLKIILIIFFIFFLLIYQMKMT